MSLQNDLIARIDHFWKKNPALYYGVALFLSSLFFLESPWALLPFVFLINKKLIIKALFCFLLTGALLYHHYFFPPEGTKIEGLFLPYACLACDRYGQGWSYKGVLKKGGKKLYCHSFSKDFYPLEASYRVEGTLKKLKGGSYSFKSPSPWKPLPRHLRLPAWQLRAKTGVKKYIERNIRENRAALFLIGMVTGEMEDRIMKKEFKELGLTHLMAISGLHFSLLALFFHLALRLILPHKWEAGCLLVLMTGYLLFIGNTPSVWRAWTAISLHLLGQLLEKKPSPLNSLGVALLISMLCNPLSATYLSLQLSFLATGGILLFYTPVQTGVEKWLPKKELLYVMGKSRVWQHGYLALAFLRQSLTLTLTVHLTLLPLMIVYFHQIPLNSLIYNLFFPFLASTALLFFMVSIPLGSWALGLTQHYCTALLKICSSPPLIFPSLYVKSLPGWALSGIFTLALALAIRCKVEKQADSLSIADDPLFNHL